MPLVVVLPVPFTPTIITTSGGVTERGGTLLVIENILDLLLEQLSQLGAVANPLALAAFAQSVDDLGGSGHAEIRGKQHHFQLFQRLLVHLASERDDALDALAEVLARAR